MNSTMIHTVAITCSIYITLPFRQTYSIKATQLFRI